MGRESFLWQVKAIRAVHQGPIAVIVRGAYINKLVSQSPELLAQLPETEQKLRDQLIQLYRSCDRIICIAQHLVTSVQKVVGAGEVPVTFLPNPIDLSDFTAIAPPRPDPNAPIQLFMAAQLKARKRPLDAVEIMQHLVTRGADCYLTICGDGIDRQQMLDLIAHYGLEERIRLKGKLERREIIQYLQQAEIVLLCSDNEGRPRVLQEAIAASRAIVAYDNPGSREVINSWLEPWQWGRLVAIGDTVAASRAILELAQLLRQYPPRSIPIHSSQSILQQYINLFSDGNP
ncbi:MAG: glycosyltransferase family 4 protein [Coleofasciculaceae cyanobacterium SM2_1_6]|nr:glycosyltransferase family 4 protein [Coleofasciculaceae cyanobacterium SM2_1_6]